jgi:hypothetical protein
MFAKPSPEADPAPLPAREQSLPTVTETVKSKHDSKQPESKGQAMRQVRLITLALLGTASLLVPAGGALASTHATSSQASAVAKAVRSSPVDDIDKVPTQRYSVTNVRISTVSKAWAMASLVPTKAYRNAFQPATAVAVKPAGTREWVVVDLGTAEVGCGIAPNRVLADLLGLKGTEVPCPTGAGIP